VLTEPFVENLVEYNIAVMKNADGKIITSAIERPNASGEFLSFKDKYLDGGKKKAVKKKAVAIMPSQQLINSRREFNPSLAPAQESFIRESAVKLFAELGATGCPRIDFNSNGMTGEIWLNEVNPIPGAMAFYLWAQAKPAISYQELANIILANANRRTDNIDLKQAASVVFR